MALYYDLSVYGDVYRLILKIFEYTKDFSLKYKYTPGQDLKRDSIVLVRSIYRANKAWRPFWMTARFSNGRCASALT